ncbi:muts domain protein, family 5 [hydrocarbon metagenome]|uniref:Muts domain protein, family 5 n=1 Tax=hydrocarbon metagenome TaxID=938273 RepID=A0A0W8E1V7_9ZZZZ
MTFHSILFERFEDRSKEVRSEVPEFFADLNLDQIIDAITADRPEYNLKPFFYTSLDDIDTIKYRHAIMRDLENETLFEIIKTFAQEMRSMRDHIDQAAKLYYKYQKEGWFLEAVEIYCEAVICLVHDLNLVNLQSRGFIDFCEYVTDYTQSIGFKSLLAETKKLKAGLSTVKYCLLISDRVRKNAICIEVRKYESEIDYSEDVVNTFKKFKQEAVKEYLVNFSSGPDMNHVEAGILDLVAQMYPDIFKDLDDYYARNSDYQDNTLNAFDREIQFYLAYLEYAAKFKMAGLEFCYPQIADECKEVYNYEGFDLALANKLIAEKSVIVCNDFYLRDHERILVVSGPNQGGKTTFARTFGQLHYLANLGCPVPGRKAQLLLFDRLFTHFEKEENIHNLSGKLQDELIRIYNILNQSSSNSIIIMNEIFTSTTLTDAVLLSKQIMERIIKLDILCVCVTFIDELGSYSSKTVSMVSNIVPENPALRTYKIERRPADGLAYALSIAEKYRLTYDCLKERIKS